MANAWIPCGGYPTAAYGQTKVWKGDHVGPALYVTGGEIIVPNSFGFPGGIEDIQVNFGGFSASNNYYAKAFPPANSQNANEQIAPTWGQGASNANNTNAIQLLWYYAANNNQVALNTNLAAEVIRCTAWGT